MSTNLLAHLEYLAKFKICNCKKKRKKKLSKALFVFSVFLPVTTITIFSLDNIYGFKVIFRILIKPKHMKLDLCIFFFFFLLEN